MLDFLKRHGSKYSDSTDHRHNGENSSNLRTIREVREQLHIRSKEVIVDTQSMISSLDQGCIFPNTINVIQGRKGVHKSRLTEILCATLLNKEPRKIIAGFCQTSPTHYSVLYVDTERNQKDQFPKAIQRIKLASGFTRVDDVPNFDFISLIDIERAQRFSSLKEYIEYFRKAHQGHVVIILDVVTDCVENFNSPTESMRLIDMMNVMINHQDVTFVCVIHENPGLGEKARGHLGTEVVNKASQVIQIGFEKDKNNNDTDLIRLKFLHSRDTKRLETVHLRYSDEIRSLVLADTLFIKDQQDKRLTKGVPTEIKEWLRENLTQPTSKENLIAELKSQFDCSERTLESRLTELTTDGFLVKSGNKKDRRVYYELSPL